jgi:DNA-binding NtrC family response regulator
MIDRGHSYPIRSNAEVALGDTARSAPKHEQSGVDGKCVVLVADPDATVRATLARALAGEGYRAIVTESAESAIATVRRERIDALVLEFRLPDMRGDVLFELASSHWPALRYTTVFVTADTGASAAKAIAACGCGLIRKPFEPSDVLAALARLTP